MHIQIYKDKKGNTLPIKFNKEEYFVAVDMNQLFKEIDNKQINLDNMGSFFVKDINSDQLFRIYVGDFRVGKYGVGLLHMEEFVNDSPPYYIGAVKKAGTIEFK